MLRLRWLLVLLLGTGTAVAAGLNFADVAHGPSAEAESAHAAPNSADARASVEALERDWLAHLSDRATLERILANDFVHVVPEGLILTKAQHISWAVEHPMPKNRHARFEELRVRVYGDTAIANGIVVNSADSGADAQRSIFTDVFAFRDGAWQAVNAQENRIQPRS